MELWGDEKFESLTPLKPSGQALWLYLLTGPFRTSIPGLSVRIGLGALSDRLGWAPGAVQKHWQEIETQEMAWADWKAGVVFLPKGIAHNEPESPNVVKAWAKVVLPECPLVGLMKESLRSYLGARLSQAYVKAFDEAFSKGSPNQEQEQEQDLVQNTERSELAKPHPIRDLLAEHERLFIARYGRKPAPPTGKDIGHASALVKAHGFDEAVVLLRAYFASADGFIAGCGHGLGVLVNSTVQNKLIAEMSGRGGPRATPVQQTKAALSRFIERGKTDVA